MKTTAVIACLACAGAGFVYAQETDYSARPGLMMPKGIILFYGNEGPLSFVTPTRSELPPGAFDSGPVKGRSCQHGVSIPILGNMGTSAVSGVIGNGGYRKVLDFMRNANPGLEGIYDVKIDVRVFSILGLYRKLCVEVEARGFRLPQK